MILRRGVLATLALPGLAHAQRRRVRIGILSPGQLTVDLNRATLITELGKAGYVEGRNLEIIGRSSDGDLQRIPVLAAALVALQPDVIVAVSNPVAHAIRAVNATVPIVMSFAGSDPVADGLASSLARPGGSVTGIVMLAEELDVKRVELALEAFPTATRIGLLAGSSYPADRVARLTAAARRLGTELVTVRAEGPESFARAFTRLVELRAHALLISASPGFHSEAAALARHAERSGLPTVCELRSMASAGCVLSLGPLDGELRRRVAGYVQRILRGEAPGTIPMEQAERFELVANLRAARALGLGLPVLVLARADEVLE
ncbi:ABC transporter substrate-binding protein [Neoroseomonas rubea]|uniref:ABC transporter substrate-binding protein n=1 Tax=Neoroseomonas rubea TaxID=2748666 RepID=UPI0018E05AEF|nr:ABC transporter substrate-binding protein [Roseomonas rubea]